MHRLTILYTFLKIGIMNELAYRANFYFQFLSSLMSLGTAIAGLYVVFNHTETLGDWTATDILALLGVYLIVNGAIRLVIQPSMERLMEDVREGTLDYTLTKPEDAQFLISISQIRIWKVTDFLLGAGVLGVALNQRGAEVGYSDAVAFGVVLLCGAAIIYSFWLMLATLAFWFIRIENIFVIFDTMYQAGRWPIGIYPFWLKFILTFIVPIAFAITVPAQALTNRLTSDALILDIAIAIGMLLVSRVFWRIGLRNYSGASA
jgi:ABC-2 type transport system permease protein